MKILTGGGLLVSAALLLSACETTTNGVQEVVEVPAVEVPEEVALLQCDRPRPNLLPGLLEHIATKGTAGEAAAIAKIEGFLARQEFDPPLALAALAYLKDDAALMATLDPGCQDKLGV